ncbi:hypothetical protein BDU57DRAFT_132414 [Ampelomyces quisqualis]|uniref:Uncharacterized protein n=1 Tax=Ampelomyces quisqualis TaxID=50730 RepID=A0A6A5QUR5_AMPQU|nr:hypothetical protein BDU57DRAFT_132414 [Ampelomyces quisqualis]
MASDEAGRLRVCHRAAIGHAIRAGHRVCHRAATGHVIRAGHQPPPRPRGWSLVEDVESRANRLLAGTVKGKCEENWRVTWLIWWGPGERQRPWTKLQTRRKPSSPLYTTCHYCTYVVCSMYCVDPGP